MSVNSVSSMNVMPQKAQAKKKDPIAKGAIIGAVVGSGFSVMGCAADAAPLFRGNGFDWSAFGKNLKNLGTTSKGLLGTSICIGLPALVGAGIGAIVKACKKDKAPSVENK